MSKRIFKIILVLLCFFILMNMPKAKSLKDLKDELARDEANKSALIQKSKEVQGKIDSLNKKLSSLNKEIEENEAKIEETKLKIEDLNVEIANKKEEIKTLFNFLQVSEGDNVYMEYIFEAKTFTDFIYRNAIVEQLTKYNDELIDEMYKMIEEYKKTQAELEEEIKKNEASITNLEKTLKEYDLDMNDIDEEKRDIEADIAARKLEISSYETIYKDNNCSEDVDLAKCVNVPIASGFIRPLKQGKITSEYGMRLHPTRGYYTMHNGIDIGGNSTGTPVYAAAAGRVNKIVNKSSCGGNMVYIQHTINGTQYRTVYMHLHTIDVKLNDVVTITTQIGTVGGGESYDGCSTGAHLHFGILKGWSGYTYYNPRNYIYFPDKGVRFSGRY